MEKQRVLVVDDDESVLEFLEAGLNAAGYETIPMSAATQALRIMKTTPGGFPVVISDITMPGIDGLQFLHNIKKEYPGTEVIMLTANATMESAIQSLKEGAFSYLRKPIDFDELKTTVKNACDKYVRSQENSRLLDELKKAKEYSESIVQSLVYTVIATDTQGLIRKTNKALEDLLGYREEELAGHPLTTILGNEFQQSNWISLAGEGPVKDFPVILRAKDGNEIRISFSGTIMKDAHGRVIGFLGTVIQK
jgi:PAS domain S-box-containing protein